MILPTPDMQCPTAALQSLVLTLSLSMVAVGAAALPMLQIVCISGHEVHVACTLLAAVTLCDAGEDSKMQTHSFRAVALCTDDKVGP